MPDTDIEISSTRPDEADAILKMTANVGVFSEEELHTVRELLDGYYDSPEESGYYFVSYRVHDQVLGYLCWGPRALSDGGYDLYWICVSREAQGRGAGRALMQRLEEEARQQQGHWIVIETSSSEHYAPARRLYERSGYQKSMELADFYHPGDNLIVYTRRLNKL
jgi:ribosomal protein S18 acetylase RimI-like enzyme